MADSGFEMVLDVEKSRMAGDVSGYKSSVSSKYVGEVKIYKSDK